MKMAVSFTCLLLLTCATCETLLAQSTRPELKLIAFSTLDTNKDGRLSRKEASADPGLYEDFDKLDVNHDGYLSPEEFQAWRRALKTKGTEIGNPATAPSGSAGAQHMPGNQP